LLEKAKNPEEFTRGLQELLKSYVDRNATKNYQRIIPDTGKFFGVPLPILRVIAAEIGKFIQKEPSEAPSLLETIWNSFCLSLKTGLRARISGLGGLVW